MFVQTTYIDQDSDPITCLRNDGDSWPKILQTNAGNLNAINNNGPTHCFNNTKQCQSEGCLSGPSPTHNTNLRVRYMKASQVTKWGREEHTTEQLQLGNSTVYLWPLIQLVFQWRHLLAQDQDLSYTGWSNGQTWCILVMAIEVEGCGPQ